MDRINQNNQKLLSEYHLIIITQNIFHNNFLIHQDLVFFVA
mgnify:CR=1 FL=1